MHDGATALNLALINIPDGSSDLMFHKFSLFVGWSSLLYTRDKRSQFIEQIDIINQINRFYQCMLNRDFSTQHSMLAYPRAFAK
jgi:hypothetical protein